MDDDVAGAAGVAGSGCVLTPSINRLVIFIIFFFFYFYKITKRFFTQFAKQPAHPLNPLFIPYALLYYYTIYI